MKYRMTKRLLAALLCACLLVTSLPLQALAAVDVTKGNSTQENAQLLQQLEALTGGDESEAAAAGHHAGLWAWWTKTATCCRPEPSPWTARR